MELYNPRGLEGHTYLHLHPTECLSSLSCETDIKANPGSQSHYEETDVYDPMQCLKGNLNTNQLLPSFHSRHRNLLGT